MAEYIDRENLKKSYYFQTKSGTSPKSELFVKRDDIFDMPTADVVEREKIDKAIEEIKAEAYSEHIDGADCDDILIVELRDVLEILKRNIGE